ncbi:MAG: type II toxin-antitoxin system VapC family toxin [Thermoproteota archaeon]
MTDASVVAAWYIPGEPWGSKAKILRDEYAEGRVRLYAPDILLYELSNSLWKAVRRKLMSLDVALACVRAFPKISPELLSLDLKKQVEALKIAAEEGFTFYDSAYVVVARATASTLVSADSDLITMARRHVNAILVDELPLSIT